MVREIAKSIREYKVVSIATPILVSFEVRDGMYNSFYYCRTGK